MLSLSGLALLALAPQHLPQRAHHAATPTRRSRPLIAPMSELLPADVVPTLEVVLPTRLVTDQVLRSLTYLMRTFDGAGFDGAGAAALHTRDVRTLLTSSVAGSVKSAQGFAAASSSAERLQHASMLAYHPLELLRWASRLFARFGGPSAGSVSLAAAARTAASSLWILWIVCTVGISVRQMRSCSSAHERRTLQYRLAKLVLDTPIALHFLCGAALLPLALVGVLGCASSLLGLRAALRDAEPAQRPRYRCAMPLLAVGSSSAVRRAWGAPPQLLACAVDDHHQLPCTPVRRRSICGCGGGSPGSPFRRGARRRTISSGPLSRSAQW